MTPPAPITGSPMNAATRPSSSSSVRSRSAGSSHATVAVPRSARPKPSMFAGMPASDVPYAFMPWYAWRRETMTWRSGWPSRLQ